MKELGSLAVHSSSSVELQPQKRKNGPYGEDGTEKPLATAIGDLNPHLSRTASACVEVEAEERRINSK